MQRKTIKANYHTAMAQQTEQIRASPNMGLSIAYKVMDDAVTFYLSNGNPQTARDHIEQLANALKFYPDSHDAYLAALSKIGEAERHRQQDEELRHQQELHDIMMSAMGVLFSNVKPNEKPLDDKSGPTGDDTVMLPPQLSTESAMKMWQRVQQAGYVDNNYQPLISRTQAALLADNMASRLGIYAKWKTFEKLWHRKNMRSDYNDAMKLVKTGEFLGILKKLLSD